MDAYKQFQTTLEVYGGETASKAIELLLKDPYLAALQPYTQFIAKNWRDCFSPAMVSLGCQAAGGSPKGTEEIAASVSLMNLSFRLWDDIIDKTSYRTLRRTFVGEFGENITLVYGGAVSAKAFTIINEAELEASIRHKVSGLIWNYWAIMARSEAENESLKNADFHALDKLKKIEREAINVQTCLKIGAILGNGSVSDIEQLENFGLELGVMLDLLKDVKVSLNLTLELEHKIRSNQLPLLLLMAKEESGKIKEKLELLKDKSRISPEDIGSLIEEVQASNAWTQYLKYYTATNKKCHSALIGESNVATEALITIARSQSKVFWEIIK